jgi:dihydropteroate synthase
LKKIKLKDTTFYKKQHINCGGKLLDLSTPKVMAIVNLTPDSFYDGGTNNTKKKILLLCEKHLKAGAEILDVGGQSTRPGAEQMGSDKELKRVLPALEVISKEFPESFISIDTYHAKVAEEAVSTGAHIINDISAGSLDDSMHKVVLELGVPYIASHIKGTPQNMGINPFYSNVTTEVYNRLSQIKNALFQKGFNDLIIDPGFGFGKTIEQNFELLNNLTHFKNLNVPIIVGFSRKSMIWKTLGKSPKESLNGTTSLNTIALLKGANIIRVHDVQEAIETITLCEALAPE